MKAEQNVPFSAVNILVEGGFIFEALTVSEALNITIQTNWKLLERAVICCL